MSRQICHPLRNGDGVCDAGIGDSGFFFVLALTGRSVCNCGFVERPIVLGAGWWLVTGEPEPALPLAVFFELFWLDLFPIGSYVPPMAAFPFLLLMALSGIMGWIDPVTLAFPLAVSLPLAYAIPVLEQALRDMQKSASSLLYEASSGDFPLGGLPGRLVCQSALLYLAVGMAAFAGVYAGVRAAFTLAPVQSFLIPLDVDWPVLYIIAAIGGLLSLRIRRSFIVFGLCTGVLLLARIF